jgi:hypothetical protein
VVVVVVEKKDAALVSRYSEFFPHVEKTDLLKEGRKHWRELVGSS